jgi:succinate dehydrogenase / fumarate reductase membrane anchor subunit
MAAPRDATQDGPPIEVMRSPLGRARGLGSAKSGVPHWWVQRVTSVALLPLTAWFVVSVLRLARVGEKQALHWAHQPVNTVLLLALVLATFHHLQLGLQVVIEDYVHPTARVITLVAMKGVVALLALASLVSVLKLAL